MGLNDVVFNKQQGGLGRGLPGSDYISGMLFFSGTLPSGFTTTYNKKQVFAVSDAEALGIVDTFSDETAAIGVVTISGSPVVGDTLNITVTEPTKSGGTTSVDLGTGTAPATPTVTTYAAAVVAAINALTFSHGYSATNTAGVIYVSVRKGLGVAMNTGTPIAITATGTGVAAITQQFGTGTGGATAGVASKLAVWHYHISEYFRLQPQGNLWIGFYPVPSTYDYAELQDLQSYATTQGSSLRQVLIYHLVARTASNVLSDCTAIQAVCATLETLHMPLSVIHAPNIKAITDISTLLNLATLSANKVSVNISQDGAGTGAQLYMISGVSITTGGALLGAVSLAAVSESIAWVQKFNISNGVECDTIAFSNGKLLTDTTITTNLLTQLNLYRYIFLRSFVDFAGSYFNDSHCAIAQSSDYAYIENNRTIDKAIRLGRAALLPYLNSPLSFNADGTLTDITIAAFRGSLATASAPMKRANEISQDGITIDPKQKSLTTSSVYISFKIIPNGVARNIIVNIGYTTSL